MAGTMRGPAVLGAIFLALACITALPALAERYSPDGLPRPNGYPTPTTAYGPTPLCLENGVPATCEWYGFAHYMYPVKGAQCLRYTREVLSNTAAYPPGDLLPFEYYFLTNQVFDFWTNASYCVYGCFDMGTTVGSPPSWSPPPPDRSPPPPDRSPPPPDRSPPPPKRSTPPPVVSPGPPPPSVSTTPPPVDAGDPPPPPSSTTRPDSATTPPPPPPPPPPPNAPTVFILSGTGFLQPKGLVLFIISGALLFLNGLDLAF